MNKEIVSTMMSIRSIAITLSEIDVNSPQPRVELLTMKAQGTIIEAMVYDLVRKVDGKDGISSIAHTLLDVHMIAIHLITLQIGGTRESHELIRAHDLVIKLIATLDEVANLLPHTEVLPASHFLG